MGRAESSAPTSCHSEPVRRLAWESVSPRLPLRGRCQREALTEGEMPRVFLSPSRLRRQPPPRGGLTARRCRADGTSYPKGICSAALHCRTPSPMGGAMWASSPTERRRGVPYRRRSQDILATARPPMRTVTAPSFSYRTLRISDGRDMCSPCRNTFSSPGFTSPRR